MAEARTYHSVGVLLQDGRVFSGGGGLCGGCSTNHFNGQILTPPYLLTADGTAAARPTITVSSPNAVNGDDLTVESSGALSRICIIRCVLIEIDAQLCMCTVGNAIWQGAHVLPPARICAPVCMQHAQLAAALNP